MVLVSVVASSPGFYDEQNNPSNPCIGRLGKAAYVRGCLITEQTTLQVSDWQILVNSMVSQDANVLSASSLMASFKIGRNSLKHLPLSSHSLFFFHHGPALAPTTEMMRIKAKSLPMSKWSRIGKHLEIG